MQPAITETPRIMIVDDTPQNLQLLEAMLRDQGYQVFALPNGEMALNAAARDQPHLILLDILMPGLDGYAVCARLKADPKLRDIPVLFLSALHEPWDKVRAFQAGGVDYLTKPYQLEEVEARVRVHLKLRQLQRDLAGHNARLEATVSERTQQLAEAHARLASLDQAKSKFLTTISHELRTPLNGLFGIAELLFLELPATPLVEGYRRLFDDSRQRILALVEDALLLTQIQAAADRFAEEISPLDAVLERALEQARGSARSAGVHLAAAPPTAGRVMGRADLLTKALHSLLQMAVKFSPRGGTVRLAVTPVDGGQRLVLETLGRALPPDELPRLFETLAIDRPIAPGGDLGLAPAVAACLIKAFGGDVAVENLEPPGVRFIVRLKAAQPGEAAA
jgi:DNA-binding response OmpR family regulator